MTHELEKRDGQLPLSVDEGDGHVGSQTRPGSSHFPT